MKTKSTPGPWEVINKDGAIEVATLDGLPVAQFWKNGAGENRINDAVLIAAAPDLREALERLVFAAECRDNTTGDPARLIQVKAELAAAAEQARIAITKSTGGN